MSLPSLLSDFHTVLLVSEQFHAFLTNSLAMEMTADAGKSLNALTRYFNGETISTNDKLLTVT